MTDKHNNVCIMYCTKDKFSTLVRLNIHLYLSYVKHSVEF